MFSRVLTDIEQGIPVDSALLLRRFDLAMTKKLAVVKLPPAFWMQDPKINPRADQLLQIALILGDSERCAMAASVLAVELAEKKGSQPLEQAIREISAALMAVSPDERRAQITDLTNELLSNS